jgi:hypothetical protein
MNFKFRNARVVVFKCVMEFTFQIFNYLLATVEGHGLLLDEVVTAHIVESSDMIPVGMGEQHGVESVNVFPKHLLPEIRAGIYDQTGSGCGDVDRGAESFVQGVFRPAYLAFTGDYRYT